MSPAEKRRTDVKVDRVKSRLVKLEERIGQLCTERIEAEEQLADLYRQLRASDQ